LHQTTTIIACGAKPNKQAQFQRLQRLDPPVPGQQLVAPPTSHVIGRQKSAN
jgi:hypothetical protein